MQVFFQQNTPEEDFSEPIPDEHSVQNEFISDSFAQTEQGALLNSNVSLQMSLIKDSLLSLVSLFKITI